MLCCGRLATLAMAMMLSPALAQVLPPLKPAPAPVARNLSPQDLPRLTLAEAQRSDVFLGVRNIPRSESAAVIGWIQMNSGVLPPVYGFELANRLWDLNPDQAFEWYSLAWLRALYDSERCVDPTARQGIAMLPGLAENVRAAIDARRAEYGRAGLRALARVDVFSDGVSPMWICLHGMRAMNLALRGQSVTEAELVRPKAEWKEIQQRLRAQYTRYFEEQGKPQDDPFPLAAAPPPYTEVAQALGGADDFAWLDSTTLVFSALEKGADGKSSRRLLSWSARSGVSRWEATGFTALCAGDGRLMIRTRVERADGRITVHYEHGTPAQRAADHLTLGKPPQWPAAAHSGMLSWSLDESGMRLNPFTCKWVPVPMGDQSLPLHDGDGLLRWPRSATPAGGGRLEWFPPGGGETITLPIDSSQVPFHGVRYEARTRSYFISPVTRAQSADARPGCVPLVRLYPGEKRFDQQCAPTDALSENPLLFTPTAAGVVRALGDRRTFHGPKVGGLYLTDAAGKTVKIYESRVRSTQVSPDGCSLAFLHAPEKALASSLGVLNLCK